jgi:hypothetical protein
MPKLGRLLGQGLNEMRMSVAEGIDGDPGAEIQISFAVAPQEPGPLPPLEGHVGARIGRQQRRGHGRISDLDARSQPKAARHPKNESAARLGRRSKDSSGAKFPVNSRELKSIITPEATLGKRVPWGKQGGVLGDSCARVSRSCRLAPVEYDISCGGITPQGGDPRFTRSDSALSAGHEGFRVVDVRAEEAMS